MAKGFTTYHLISGKEPLLRRVVCEVRYRDGHLYLDHSGRLLKKLLKSPEWVLSGAAPGGTSVFHITAGATLSFSSQGASFEVDNSNADEVVGSTEIEEFVTLADESLSFLFDELEVKEWSRIGYREYYYFPCESKQDTEAWLAKLGIQTVCPGLPDAFEAQVDATSFTIILEGESCSYRIGLGGVERSAQVPMGDNMLVVRASGLPEKQKEVFKKALKKQRQRQINSAFAAVLDIDSYRADPIDLNIAGFIRECSSTNLERFRSAVAGSNGKKGK